MCSSSEAGSYLRLIDTHREVGHVAAALAVVALAVAHQRVRRLGESLGFRVKVLFMVYGLGFRV